MTDRWNPKRVTIQTPKPARLVMVDAPAGAVEPRGKTWGIRVRGDVDKLASQSYRCPVHGEFTALVPLSDVPQEVFCSKTDLIGRAVEFGVCTRTEYCGRASPWAGSSCGIGHAAGEVES